MQIITYVQDLIDLQKWEGFSSAPVLISPLEFSKRGVRKVADYQDVLEASNVPVFLEWDVLHTENEFKEMVDLFEGLDLDKLTGVRVLDVGVCQYIKSHHPELKIQFIAEAGNHNLNSLKVWKNYLGKQLDRLILSKEIPHTKWKEYIDELEGKVEWQLLGPIELFYSPRLLMENTSPGKMWTGESDETAHKNFRFWQNGHGTFMDFPKDHFLMDKIEEIEAMGLKFAKVDSRHLKSFEVSLKAISLLKDKDLAAIKEFKNQYPLATISGFYYSNKSDILFEKIKNPILGERDGDFIGRVVAIEKPSYMAIEVNDKSKIGMNQRMLVKTPEGKSIEFSPKFIKNIFQKDLSFLEPNQLGLLPYVKGVIPKSMIYLVNK